MRFFRAVGNFFKSIYRVCAGAVVSIVKSKTKLAMLIVTLVYLFSGLFTLGTFKMPSKAYYAEKENTVDDVIVVLKLEYEENQSLDSIWIHLGAMEVKEGLAGSIQVNYTSSATSTGSRLVLKEFYNAGHADSKLYSWQPVYEGVTFSSSNTYIRLLFKNDMKVNEIVFLDKKDNVIKASVYSNGKTTAVAEGFAKGLLDEQNKFTKKQTFLNTVTQRESYTLSAVNNLLENRGYVTDGEANAFGVELTALGVAIFGYNTIGLRIIPFLFSVATLILLFCLGGKLFNADWIALLFGGLYILSGFAFTAGRAGGVIPIFAFFMLLSIYFMYNYFTVAATKKSVMPTVKYLLLSGGFFTLSLAVSTMAVFGLIPLAGLFIAGVIRTVKAYNALIAKSENNQSAIAQFKEKKSYKLRFSTAIVLCSFIVLPVLFITLTYLPYFKALGITYNDSRFFNVMLKDIGSFFSYSKVTVFSKAGSSVFIGWPVGLKAGVLFKSAAGGRTMAVSLNLVYALLSLVSFALLAKFMITYAFSKQVLKADYNKFNGIKYQYLMMMLAFFGFLLPFAFIKCSDNILFYTANIFYAGFICLFAKQWNEGKDKKRYFVGKKAGIKRVHMVCITAVTAITLNFLMTLPLMFAISVGATYSASVLWIAALKKII